MKFKMGDLVQYRNERYAPDGTGIYYQVTEVDKKAFGQTGWYEISTLDGLAAYSVSDYDVVPATPLKALGDQI